MKLRIASYNLHKCRGTGWRRDPARNLEVIAALGADVVALQETDLRLGARPAALPPGLVAEMTDLVPVEQPRTGPASLGWHGQAVLVRRGLVAEAADGIPLPGFEPRGALALRIALTGANRPFLLVAAHLGLRRADRRLQWARLRAAMQMAHPLSAVAVGDFNEWSDRRGFEPLAGYGLHAPGPTYPARSPIGRLDRIVVSPRARITAAGVLDSALARRASDHLPVWADIEGL